MCRRVANRPVPGGPHFGKLTVPQPQEDNMANLGKKNGVYLARFRYQGKEYKRSLKTNDRKSAEAAMHRVEEALHRLAIGLIQIPTDIDPGDFILKGGTFTRRPILRQPSTLDAAVDEYLSNIRHLAESNRYTIGVHLRNLKKHLLNKNGVPLDRIEQRDLEGFLQARLKERAHTTVSKERETIANFFDWAVGYGYLEASPAENLTRIKTCGDLPPFRTVQEIEQIVSRGGLADSEAWALWDCLYLTPSEIAEVLVLVSERAKRDVSFILHAIPAYTGMRRGEVLRLRWSDIEFNQQSLIA